MTVEFIQIAEHFRMSIIKTRYLCDSKENIILRVRERFTSNGVFSKRLYEKKVLVNCGEMIRGTKRIFRKLLFFTFVFMTQLRRLDKVQNINFYKGKEEF